LGFLSQFDLSFSLNEGNNVMNLWSPFSKADFRISHNDWWVSEVAWGWHFQWEISLAGEQFGWRPTGREPETRKLYECDSTKEGYGLPQFTWIAENSFGRVFLANRIGGKNFVRSSRYAEPRFAFYFLKAHAIFQY